MNSLTILALLVLAIWWYKPLRVFLVQRTNRSVKVLLIVMPALFVARVGYNVYRGEQDDLLSSMMVLVLMVALWVGLVWLGNTLERRRPTKSRGPDLQTLQTLSRLPGMPRIPAAATNPEVHRVARAAAGAASKVDWGDVAGSVGRTSGKWAARLKKSMASNDTTPRRTAPPAAPAPKR